MIVGRWERDLPNVCSLGCGLSKDQSCSRRESHSHTSEERLAWARDSVDAGNDNGPDRNRDRLIN